MFGTLKKRTVPALILFKLLNEPPDNEKDKDSESHATVKDNCIGTFA